MKQYVHNYVSPPEMFEKQYGLTGISKNWTMPLGFTPEYIEIALMKNRKKIEISKEIEISKKYFNLIANINRKDVEKINIDNAIVSINPPDPFYHAVFGMTSKMNIDDINYWLAGNNGLTTARDYEYIFLRNKILEKLSTNTYVSIGFNWVPSIKTLEKIWEDIK